MEFWARRLGQDWTGRGSIPLASMLALALMSLAVVSSLPVNEARGETVGAWTQTTSYPSPNPGGYTDRTFFVPCVESGGYEYCVAGEYASLSSAGVGSWTATTAYPNGLSLQACAAYSGYIYCVGGTLGSPPSVTNAVYFAPLSSKGIGAWSQTTTYPGRVYGATCVTASGYIYCVGGDHTIGAGEEQLVAFAPVSASGIGAWTITTSYPLSLNLPNCVTGFGYIYCVGGYAYPQGFTSAAYYASISSSGVGSWTATTEYTNGSPGTCLASGGFDYCLGEYGGAGSSLVSYAQMSQGGIGPWTSTTSYPGHPGPCVASASYLYCIGGTGSDSSSSAVYYAQIATGAPASLAISDVDSSGSALNGFYIDSVMDLTTSAVLMSGTYTPQSLSVPAGDTISVTLDDYGSYYVVGSNIGTFSRTTANGGGGTSTLKVQGDTNLVFTMSTSTTTTTSSTTTTTSTTSSTTALGIVMSDVQSSSGTVSQPPYQITLPSFNAGAGSNRLLVVGVSANNNSVSSITFGGAQLTQAVASFYNNDAEFWYLVNPTGTGDVVVTFEGPTSAVVGAYSFSGVDQTNPIPTTSTNHGGSGGSPPYVSIATQHPGSWVLDLPSIFGDVTLGSSSCTQHWDLNVPNAITGASSSTVATSPGTFTCGWTASNVELWDDVAVEVAVSG